jgi:hypothetical protein
LTLVVACKSENDIFMVGDTRVLNHYNQPLSVHDGALKVLTISKNICIGFAGDISNQDAEFLTEICRIGHQCVYDEIVDKLTELHKKNDGRLDFIIGSLAPTPELVVIRNMQVNRNVNNAWIGHPDAFEVFQQARLSGHSPDQNCREDIRPKLDIRQIPEHIGVRADAFIAMCDAMSLVVENESIPSVGDFYVAVSSGTDGFHYLSHARVDAPPQPPHSGERTVEFGSAQEGGCSLTTLTPKPGCVAIGFHYFQGNFGVLFNPQKSFNPLVFREVTCKDFVEKVRCLYNIDLEGPMFN